MKMPLTLSEYNYLTKMIQQHVDMRRPAWNKEWIELACLAQILLSITEPVKIKDEDK